MLSSPETNPESGRAQIEELTAQLVAPERPADCLECVLESRSVGVAVADRNLCVTRANRAFLSLLGYEPADLPLDPAALRSLHRSPARTPQRQELTSRDGHRVPVLVATVSRPGSGEHIVFVVEATESGELATRRAARATERWLSEERERRRIAIGLHDDVGHSLVTAKMRLEGVLRRPLPAEIADPLKQVRELLSSAVDSTRTLTFDLSCPVLYELGLDAALDTAGRRLCEEAGISFRFHSDGGPRAFEKPVALILHRTVRELLRNVVLHAQARNAEVGISESKHMLKISVADDGIGIERAPNQGASGPRAGFGLLSVCEHLASLGGRLEVDSSPGKGTRATVLVPLPTE